MGSRIVNVWIWLDSFRLYPLHLAHSHLSHIAPTFWSNSSSGNKVSSWSNTSRNSKPAWRSYKQPIRDSSSLRKHHSSADLSPKSQNPPQNHAPHPKKTHQSLPPKPKTQHLRPHQQTASWLSGAERARTALPLAWRPSFKISSAWEGRPSSKSLKAQSWNQPATSVDS